MRGTMYDRSDLKWDGNRLRVRTGRLLATIEQHDTWPGMWRVRHNGRLSDLTNRARAKDATVVLALASLNHAMPAAA